MELRIGCLLYKGALGGASSSSNKRHPEGGVIDEKRGKKDRRVRRCDAHLGSAGPVQSYERVGLGEIENSVLPTSDLDPDALDVDG